MDLLSDLNWNGNTEGRIKDMKYKKILKIKDWTEQEKGYIAGFIDGDGSIISQIVKDKTHRYKFYIRISLVFYQKSTSHWFILQLQKKFKPYGYVRKRGVMSEFVIVEKGAVKLILEELYPYFILKKNLCRLVLEILKDLEEVETNADFLKVCEKVDKTANYTYSKNRKITSDFVKNDYFNSPVETSFKEADN